MSMPAETETAVRERVAELDVLLRSHAGGLEVVRTSGDGTVGLRFTGACTGCPVRPVTFRTTVLPSLLAIAGVADVTAEGSRVSEQAERRLAELVMSDGSGRVLACLNGPGDPPRRS